MSQVLTKLFGRKWGTKDTFSRPKDTFSGPKEAFSGSNEISGESFFGRLQNGVQKGNTSSATHLADFLIILINHNFGPLFTFLVMRKNDNLIYIKSLKSSKTLKMKVIFDELTLLFIFVFDSKCEFELKFE
jgi:hypothetical protein